MRWPLLAALLAALPLAGCASPGGDGAGPPGGGVVQVPSSDLAVGGYYAFRHAGGALDFALVADGAAAIELFDGSDQRLGQIEFGADNPPSIAGVPAGEPVLHVVSLSGDLQVLSDGVAVERFTPLLATVERALLVSRAPPSSPIYFPGLTGDTLDETVDVLLLRGPSSLRLLASGQYENLAVEVVGQRGPALRLEASGSTVGGPEFVFGFGLTPVLGAETFPQNFGEGRYEARLSADDLSGALVLESATYSRAAVPQAAGIEPSNAEPDFVYGDLPDEASSFEVHQDATALFLTAAAATTDAPDEADPQQAPAQEPEPVTAAAWVALYDPDDLRLGVVQVPGNGTVRVPIARGGEYVAVVISGSAVLAADVAPRSFQIHPLSLAETTVPQQPAGDNGRYALERANVTPEGIPFRVEATTTGGSTGPGMPTGGCSQGGFVRLEQAGEAILLAGDVETSDQQGTLRVANGPLELVYDGFGQDGCAYPAITIHGYVRNPLG